MSLTGSRVLAKSWKITVYEDMVKGKQSGVMRPYVRLVIPDFTMVVAVRKSDGKIPIIRHYRAGARSYFWELPAGHIENGESPIESVKREFAEEIGYELLKPRLLRRIFTLPSRTSQIGFLFSGTVGKKIASTDRSSDPDELREMQVKFVSPSKARNLLTSKIESMPTLGFLLWFKRADFHEPRNR